MSDIAFNPVMSTNEIFRGNNRSQFLTNDLDAIEADIQTLETEKANVEHTHSGYAPVNHTTVRAIVMMSSSEQFTSSKNLKM